MTSINKNVIRHVKKTVNKIEESLFPTLRQVFTQNADVIKFIQTQEQLFKRGEDSRSISITPKYAQSTLAHKLRKRQPTDRVTLKDTGDFYESINVVATKDSLVIETSIEYAHFLVKRYGKEILGIQRIELSSFYEKYIEKEIEQNVNDIIRTNQL